jgi:hypothetical protein
MGDETVKVAFKDPAAMRRFADIVATIEAKNPNTTGRVAIQLGQAGAAGYILTHPTEGPMTRQGAAAYTIIFGPAVLARVLTNPTALRWMTQGLEAGAGTPAFSRLVGQAIATASKQMADEASASAEASPAD